MTGTMAAAPAPDPWGAWDAQGYLMHYYARLEADEAATLAFITQACTRITRPARALVFGVGPTVHHLLPLAPHVREIHVADYLSSNLDHVQRWLRREARAHDWRAFARHVLQCEGKPSPTEAQVTAREDLVRSKVTRSLHADASHDWPLTAQEGQRYDLVVSCYCAESATGDRDVWRRYVHNILRLLAPGGLFITAALRRCRTYSVGRLSYPSANIDEHDLAALLLEAGADRRQLQLEVRRVGLGMRLGYDSIVLAATSMAGRPEANHRLTPPDPSCRPRQGAQSRLRPSRARCA